jgi:hypothetical protein
MTTEKLHWSERARDLTDRTMEFMAEHGSTVGMTGAAIAGGLASASMVQALGIGGGHDVDLLRASAATFIMTGTAAAVSGSLLEKFARNALGDERYEEIQYDQKWMDQVEATINAPKGAVPVIDDPTRGPQFKEAMRKAMETVDKDSDTKDRLVDLLSRSPEARQNLVNEVFRNIDGESKEQEAAINLLKESNNLNRGGPNNDTGNPSLN